MPASGQRPQPPARRDAPGQRPQPPARHDAARVAPASRGTLMRRWGTPSGANAAADVDLWIADTTGVVGRQFQVEGSASEIGSIRLAAAQDALLIVVGAGADTGYSLSLDGRAP